MKQEAAEETEIWNAPAAHIAAGLVAATALLLLPILFRSRTPIHKPLSAVP